MNKREKAQMVKLWEEVRENVRKWPYGICSALNYAAFEGFNSTSLNIAHEAVAKQVEKAPNGIRPYAWSFDKAGMKARLAFCTRQIAKWRRA